MTGGITLAPLLVEIKTSFKKFTTDMKAVGKIGEEAAKNVNKSLNSIGKKDNGFSKKFISDIKTMEKTFAATSEKMKKNLQSINNVGSGLKNVGSSLTKYVTAPLIAAGTLATKFSMDFETGMAKVSTIADTTKVPINKLKDGVIDLSNQTGMSVKDLSEGLYQALSASVDTTKAVDFLKVATKAAKGGFTDAATAVDGLSTVLNSYGLESDKVNEIANQMLITQNKGKTSFGELASSVGKVTPVSSQLNISTKELFSSLASTTAQGLATSESVTALKASMSNIIKPSKEAADAAEALGIKFNVSELQSKGWMPFLQNLKKGLEQASPELKKIIKAMEKASNQMTTLSKAGKSNSKEYKQAKKNYKDFRKELDQMAKMADSPISAMATMFGSVEGLNSILMLTSENGMNIYNDTMKEMETNTTALDDAYNKMSTTKGDELKRSFNELKNSLIGFGDAIAPMVSTVNGFISKLSAKLQRLSPQTQGIIVKAALIAAAIGPLIGFIGSLMTGICSAITVFTSLSAAMGAAGGAMALLTGPIGIVIAVVAGLALAVATNFGGIRDTIMSILGAVGSFIQAFLGVLKTMWEGDFMGIASITTMIFNQIQIIFSTVFSVIKGIFDVFACAFKGDWDGVWNAVKGIVSSIWDGILSLCSNFLNGIVNALLSIGGTLLGTAMRVFSFIKQGFSTVWNAICNWFSYAVDHPVETLKNIGSTLFNVGKSIFNSLWDGIKSIWDGICTWVSDKISWLTDKIAFWRNGKSEIDGSHYNGLNYVPFDGYVARLHKGERVLTAKENSKYNFGSNGNNSMVVNFNGNYGFRDKTDIDYFMNQAALRIRGTR